MFSAFQIGRIFGVNIRVHLLFLVLIGLVLFGDQPILGATGWEKLIPLGILWGSVLVHELGHSLVARRYGVKVLDITFWPLGGMARFVDFPTNPKIELPISVAGPGVNFLLAFLLTPFALQEPVHWVYVAWWINLALGGFNMIPAFPMDGGRVLRALLGFRNDFLRSTEIAVRIGRLFGVALCVGAFFLTPGWVYFVMGAFIWLSATQELWSVRIRHATRGGNPFVFWQSFRFGRDGFQQNRTNSDEGPSVIRGNASSAEDAAKTQRELEEFKGPLSEYFKQKKDPADS